MKVKKTGKFTRANTTSSHSVISVTNPINNCLKADAVVNNTRNDIPDASTSTDVLLGDYFLIQTSNDDEWLH